MKKILLLLFILQGFISSASNFNGAVMQFKQANGTTVDLKMFGSEYYMRAEGIDGYTVIREKDTKNICYAKLSEDGSELISTGILYTGKQSACNTPEPILSLAKHLEISLKARQATIKNNQLALSGKSSDQEKRSGNGSANEITGTPINPVSGNIRGLCIVVDFSDETGIVPMSEFIDFCNDMNYSNFGNNGSLRKFYSDISGGLVDYQNVVYGYFRAPLTFQDYDAMPYAVGAQEILGLALHWIDSLGFDFSTLSLNPDNSIQAINLMYTGNPPNWAQGMWHHKGNYTSFSADGVSSNDYNCSPANSPLQLAVVAHENGHMIGKWPDTYKYDNTTGPDGIGAFDLMCWYGDYFNPTIPNPLFLANCGWKTMVDVTNFNGTNLDTANSLTCYRYSNTNDTNEFFLMENRLKADRSTFIPDEGLTIWHIDRHGDNQTLNHEVYLVHANDDIYDHTGACFKASVNHECSDVTTPNTNFYNGNQSGLRVWDIDDPSQIIGYKLGNGFPSASLTITYQNITNDDNANGFLEAGETGDINLDAGNFGQLVSASATFTCTATGPNASMITINTPTLSLGAINVSQTIPSQFNVTISPTATIGSTVQLNFLLTDGTDSILVTRLLTIGAIELMNNQDATTCAAVFLDNGGSSNYDDNTNFTKTFYPGSVTQKVIADFTSFDLEFEASCAYDFLEIYDGPSTNSPLIGTYCGSNSPGLVTSTDLSGALTFLFHSDGGVTGTGWEATMSCTAPNGISTINNLNPLSIYPNPTNGIVTLKSNGNEVLLITLTDAIGKKIETRTLNSNQNTQLDLTQQAPGIYFLKSESSKATQVQKILLK